MTGTPRPFIASVQRAWQAVHVASQASAKHRVHDDVAIGQSGDTRFQSVPANARAAVRRLLSAVIASRAEKDEPKSRSDRCRAATDPSPPLLPGPATTADTLAPHVGNGISYGAPGILHKLNAGEAPAIARRSASAISAVVSNSIIARTYRPTLTNSSN